MKIYTRAELGSRPFRTPPATVALSRRNEVTIHYWGAGTPPRGLREFRKAIERIHMDERGWRGVGYNYVVAANGDVGEGAGRDIVGAHSPPHNVDGIGVIVWTEKGVPTEAAKRSARELYDQLCRQAGRKLRIGWHGRDYPTSCPGPSLRKWAQDGMPVAPSTGGPTGPDELDPLEEIMSFYDSKREFREDIKSMIALGVPRATMKSHTSLDGGVAEETVAAAIRRAQTIGRQNRTKLNRIEKKLDKVIEALKTAPQSAAALAPAVFDIAAEVSQIEADDAAAEGDLSAEED